MLRVETPLSTPLGRRHRGVVESLRPRSHSSPTSERRADHSLSADSRDAHRRLIERRKSRPSTARSSKTFDTEDIWEEDPSVRARRYWQKWAAHTVRHLLEQSRHEEDLRAPRLQLLYSGRLGSPRTARREASPDSDATALSLLTCSSGGASRVTVSTPRVREVTSRRSRRSAARAVPEAKPDWEAVAKERARRGVLHRMVRSDAAMLQAYISPGGPLAGIPPDQDGLSGEEQRLLLRCAYRCGPRLARNTKSASTECLLTISRRTAPRDHTVTSSASQTSMTVANSDPGQEPWLIVQQLHHRPRSLSCGDVCVVGDGEAGPGPLTRPVTRHTMDLPPSVARYQQGLQGFAGFEGKFSRRVRENIRRTVRALDRATGLGDRVTTVAPVPHEVGRYTSRDYARVPRYPQNIRIAPSLSRVISADIRRRMGRPRYHQIHREDLRRYDGEQPPLDRRQRNLMIFNWLNGIERDAFDLEPPGMEAQDTGPEIRNIEKWVSKEQQDAESLIRSLTSHVCLSAQSVRTRSH